MKKITKLFKGFKEFNCLQSTLAGIEMHHMLRKGQHIQAENQIVFEQFYAIAA
ncbi:hypothetical protein [Legionella antarctica]|uniref:hypothetical protein n=1 Tax=Legionella antarctica TaxID=2708020 RepID=UPI001563B9F5|nr:hypothetical protein [Legionella antarctica]